MLLLRSRSRLLDTQMYPQPFCEYRNIVPHWRTSGCAQFVEIRPVSTVPPRSERIQRYGESLGYLFLVHEFWELQLCLRARPPLPVAHSPSAFYRNSSNSQSGVFVPLTSNCGTIAPTHRARALSSTYAPAFCAGISERCRRWAAKMRKATKSD